MIGDFCTILTWEQLYRCKLLVADGEIATDIVLTTVEIVQLLKESTVQLNDLPLALLDDTLTLRARENQDELFGAQDSAGGHVEAAISLLAPEPGK